MEQNLEGRAVFSGKLLVVETYRVKLPQGGEAVREVVRHPGAVVVVPRRADGMFVLVKQYRFAVNQALVEFPAGTLKKGEEPAACAARELAEETGFQGKLTPLGQFYSAPGFCDEQLFCFLAEALVPGKASPDADENLEVVFWSQAHIQKAILEGQLKDAKSLAAWALFSLKGTGITGSS